MPAAYFRWRRARTIRRCSGSSRRSAGSSRSIAFMFRRGSHGPCAPTDFTVTVDRDFDAVVEACAEPWPGRSRTWINARIRTLYRKLYERRHCHSLEVYEGDNLVGGLYGVTLGRAFFGESMFHRARDASKVALVHLVARLKAGGFKLLDTQFVTDHLRTFGAIEVPAPPISQAVGRSADRRRRLCRARREAPDYGRAGAGPARAQAHSREIKAPIAGLPLFNGEGVGVMWVNFRRISGSRSSSSAYADDPVTSNVRFGTPSPQPAAARLLDAPHEAGHDNREVEN